MIRLFLAFTFAIAMLARPALAQETAWVQVEAQPSLAAAEQRARAYAGTLPDVNGFSLGGGWYAVALGPYTQQAAEELLFRYRGEGRIPRDSFIAFSGSFRQQFWPVGANLLSVTPLSLGQTVQDETAQTPAAAPAPEPEPADETPRQARASENQLSRDEKKQLQVMLQWGGFYTSAIDGAFGRGTRRSMAAWQEANNFEPTGILTTLQRATLKRQYNAVLEGLDLQSVTDSRAGISMTIPTGVVKFDRYESPFVHFEPSGSVPEAKVILISQDGTQSTLFGLYDIMQTLEIVPLDGSRERSKSSFTLIGENERFISHTEASLRDGQVKGFTLIWPRGDEERRTRLLDEMRSSFTRLDGVLEPTAGMDEAQAIDLISGLRIRTPRQSRSGFFIGSDGTTVTTLDSLESCGRVTLDRDYDAVIAAQDEATGLAVLRPVDALAPSRLAALRTVPARLKSQIAVAGFPFEGALDAPTVTYGTFADVKGLRGESSVHRLEIDAFSGDLGGPVLDTTGAVIGMFAPVEMAGRALPEGVGFSVPSLIIADLLAAAGIVVNAATSDAPMALEDLVDHAAEMTVLVSCWE